MSLPDAVVLAVGDEIEADVILTAYKSWAKVSKRVASWASDSDPGQEPFAGSIPAAPSPTRARPREARAMTTRVGSRERPGINEPHRAQPGRACIVG